MEMLSQIIMNNNKVFNFYPLFYLVSIPIPAIIYYIKILFISLKNKVNILK